MTTTPTPIVFRGGRLPADPDRPSIQYAAIQHDDLPAPPVSADWLTPVPVTAWGMLGNDAVGDCTIAGLAHKRIGDVFVNQAGRILAITTAQALAVYSAITGYTADDPSTDQGALCQQVLEYWQRNGFLGERVLAFAKVDISDEIELKRAIATFGQVYAGFDVPRSAEQQFNAGQPWTVVEDSPILGGHCVTIGAYDEDGLTAVTWGALQKMTWNFFRTYFEEVWVVISPDMIDPTTGLDHLGISLAALTREFTGLTGRRIPTPHPATAAVLKHFAYGHLRPDLQAVSAPFNVIAQQLADTLSGPEVTHALVRLVEAKDWAVRAAAAGKEV